MFGYGVTMNIVLSATIGAASWPRMLPVEKVLITRSCEALAAVISVRPLKRVPWESLPGRTQLPSSAGSGSFDRAGAAPESACCS